MNDLGKLMVRYGVDTSELDAAQGRLSQAMGNLKSQVMQGAGLIVGAAGLGGVVYSVKHAVDEFMSFDDAMTKSLAIMGNVSAEMKEQMEDAAREIGKTTRHSAKDAAEAYYFLASAGLDAAQSLAALPTVAAFAQAGAFDLARATDILTDAQSALGLTVKDTTQNMQNMTRVSDVLVKANTIANASVEQFGESLTNKAAAALRLLNKDIEEGVAVLAAFADVGVKGQVAGEQLSIVLRDLQRASIENRQAFNDYGVAVFDAQGKVRNMADIIGDLERALAGQTDEQKRVILSTLGFQERSISAMLTLVGFSDKIREYEAVLRGAGGTTEEVATKQMDSLAAQWDLLKKQLLDFAFDVIKAITPFLKSILDVIDALGGARNALILLGGTWAALKIAKWVDGLTDIAIHIGNIETQATAAAASTGVLNTALLGLAGGAIAGGIAAIGWAFSEWREAVKELEEAMARLQEQSKGETEAQKQVAEEIANVRGRVEAQARLNEELASTSDEYKNLKAEIIALGVEEKNAHNIAATALTDRSLALEGLRKEANSMRLTMAELSAEAGLIADMDQKYVDRLYESGQIRYRSYEETMAEYQRLLETSTSLYQEIYLLEAAWGELPGRVAESLRGMGAIPEAVLVALRSADPDIQAAGQEAAELYAQGIAEMAGKPSEEAKQIARDFAAAITTSNPEVRSNAIKTLQALVDGLVSSGHIVPEAGRSITGSLARALGMTNEDIAAITGSYSSTFQRILSELDYKGPNIIKRAQEIAKAIRRELTLEHSPDISYKVPAVYAAMFDKLAGVFDARLPDLEARLNLSFPVTPAAEHVGPVSWELHFHVPGFFGSQQELDDLARRLISEHIPRVSFARGG